MQDIILFILYFVGFILALFGFACYALAGFLLYSCWCNITGKDQPFKKDSSGIE